MATLDEIAMAVQRAQSNPDFIQGLARMSGRDPQEAMINHAQMQAYQSQQRIAEQQQAIGQQAPMILRNLRAQGKSPQEIFDEFLAAGFPVEVAHAMASNSAQIDASQADVMTVPSTAGLPEGYMWGSGGQAVPIPGLQSNVPQGVPEWITMLPPKQQSEAMTEWAKSKVTGEVEQKKAAEEVQKKATEGRQSVLDSISVLDQVISSEGFGSGVGFKGPAYWFNLSNYNPFRDDPEGPMPLPGTDAAEFEAAYGQLKGEQFLKGYETLKGGGQITEYEGKRAAQAQSRIDKATSETDFKDAVMDYKASLLSGQLRLQGVTSYKRQELIDKVKEAFRRGATAEDIILYFEKNNERR